MYSRKHFEIALSSNQLIMDFGLCASFHASNVVPHWVKAGLGRVDFDYGCQFVFASLKLFFPIYAKRLAEFEH